MVFVPDADEDPAEVRKPTILFATNPEMAPERICRNYRDRFQIECNFRDAKQHLGLAAYKARTAARALDRFSMANVKPRNSWNWSWQGFWKRSGRTLHKCPEALRALLELDQIEPKPT